MKTIRNAFAGLSIAAAFFIANIPPASASLTLRGTHPGGLAPVVILQPHGQTGATGVVKLLLGAPTAGAYAFSFCVGPVANPCGFAPPTSYVVNVPGGQQRLAVISAAQLANNVLVVAQGTSSALPYTVTIE
jgi:hypothetical protein